MEETICAERGWDYHDDWSPKSKRDRARLIAFQRIRAAVNSYEANKEALQKIKVELEDWIEMTEEVKEFQLKAAKAVK